MSCCCNKKVVLLNDITTTNTWTNGAGVPLVGNGSDGDYYLNDTNGDYYNKILGVWVLQGNLEGTTGPAGADGIDGIDGIDGSVINSNTNTETLVGQAHFTNEIGMPVDPAKQVIYNIGIIDRFVHINYQVSYGVFAAPVGPINDGAFTVPMPDLAPLSGTATYLPVNRKVSCTLRADDAVISFANRTMLTAVVTVNPAAGLQFEFHGAIPANTRSIEFAGEITFELDLL